MAQASSVQMDAAPLQEGGHDKYPPSHAQRRVTQASVRDAGAEEAVRPDEVAGCNGVRAAVTGLANRAEHVDVFRKRGLQGEFNVDELLADPATSRTYILARTALSALPSTSASGACLQKEQGERRRSNRPQGLPHRFSPSLGFRV